MATDVEILSALNDVLKGIRAALNASGASKLLTLDRNTGADAALVYLRENGDEKFRWGMPGGEDDFVIQHSPDGSPLTYSDVLRIDATTGKVTVTGLAIDAPSFNSASFTGQSLFADGSAAAPSIGFAGDPDTGLYSTGPNGVGIVSGGRLVMEIADDNVPVEFTMANGGVVQFSEYSVGASPRLIAAADKTDGARAYFSLRHDNIEMAAFYTNWSVSANRADLIIRHTDPNGNIDFLVANTLVGRMTNAGQLAWGGTSANYPLDVYGDIRARDAFKVGTGAGTAYGDDNLIRPSSSSAFMNIKGGAGRAKILLGNDDTNISSGIGAIVFRYGAGATDGGVEAMRVATSGRIGVKTSSPDYDFDVNGTFGVSSTATFGGNIVFSSDDFRFYPTTADAADTARVALLGGGGFTTSRGAYIYACGNEHATTPGRVVMAAGDGAAAQMSGATVSLISSGNSFIFAGGPQVAKFSSSGTELLDLLAVYGNSPTFNILETDDGASHRIIASGGVLYIQADGTGSVSDSGRLFLTGRSGVDLQDLVINAGLIRYQNGGSELARFGPTGLLLGTTVPGASKLVVADDSLQLTTPKTPASATDTGATGQIAWDGSFLYVCTAPDTWVRAALSTW